MKQITLSVSDGCTQLSVLREQLALLRRRWLTDAGLMMKE
jgi:hypothetical protein